MLEFMRTRAREIVMVTVLLFIVSLFSFGAFSFFNKNKSGNKKENVKISKIAMVNGEPVDESRFYRQLNQFFAAVPADRRILLDPDVVDFYRYDALQKTVSFMVMLSEAKKQGIKAFPQEVNYRIDQIAKMYQLKNANELKRILAERKIPWNDFKKEQREEIMVAKFVNGISSRATVTDTDKKMAFTEVRARHILIKDEEETTKNANSVSSDIKALKKAESIYEMVLANRDRFAEIAKKYSDDKLTADKGGDLGWISRGQMVQEFEKQLYKMKPGDIAGPIKTIFGYHIILALERKDKEIPAGVSEKDIENQILQEKQNEAVRRWLKPLVDSANIEIMDPALKAYEYRVKRDYPNALIQYQRILANEQQNLLMYIQIARMQEKIGRLDEAYNVLQRGIIWQKYNPQYQYPILYFSIIDFDSKNNKKDEARSYVDNVIKFFGTNLIIMETVSNNYMELISKNAREGLRKKIEELQIKEKQAKAAAAAGQQQQVPLMQQKPQQQQGPVIPKAVGQVM